MVLLKSHYLTSNSLLNDGIKYIGLPYGESLSYDGGTNIFNFLFQMNNMNDNKYYFIFFKSSEIIKKWRL
jgi:Zn-dependent M16 (insulinase) family peptidase